MKLINVFVLAAFLSFAGHLKTFGQTPTIVKHIEDREQIWLGYFNQTRLSNRFGVWADIQYRTTENFAERPFQLLIRPAVTYYIKDNLRVNIGYSHISHYPAEGMNTTRYEHRPWQQIWWNQKYTGLTTLQWLRFEQRFNERVVSDVKEEGYNYNFRVRYNFSFFVPLKGKEMKAKTPFASIGNELFLNFGDRVVYNTFDQNRLFVGFGYQFTSHTNLQFGYLNVYQQEGSGSNYLSSHAIRLVVFHNLDLRKTD